MPDEPRSRVNPRTETAPLTRSRTGYTYRYAYARSAASRASGGTGQDYLTFREGPAWFAFALCGGVGQSLFGDVAARVLGDGVLRWLEGVTAPVGAPRLRELLVGTLQRLTEGASRWVEEAPPSEELSTIPQKTLDQNRALGGQANFVCGRLDLPGPTFPQGRLLVAWMGDSRLRFWGPYGERTGELGDTFQTEQHWSTAWGPVRAWPWVHATPLVGDDGRPEVVRLLAYSDGLSPLDNQHQVLSDIDLQDLIATAGESLTSDDASVLEVWLGPPPESLRKQVLPSVKGFEARLEGSRLQVRWRSLPGAHRYQVEVWGGDGTRGIDTASTGWTSEPLPPGTYQVRARGVDAASNAGYWNKPETIQVGSTVAGGHPLEASGSESDQTSVRSTGELRAEGRPDRAAAQPDLAETVVRLPAATASEVTLVRPKSGWRSTAAKRRVPIWAVLIVFALCVGSLAAAVFLWALPLSSREGAATATPTWIEDPAPSGDPAMSLPTPSQFPTIPLPTTADIPTTALSPTLTVAPTDSATSTPPPVDTPTQQVSALATAAAGAAELPSPLATPSPVSRE